MVFSLVVGVLKTTIAAIFFILGCLSIVFTQFIGIIFTFGNQEVLYAWLAQTKKNFIVLLTTLISFVSRDPITIRFVTPDIPRSRIYVDSKGHLKAVLPPTSVIFGNHQIYTDWAFFWWFAYTAELGGFAYIILKDSLKKIPLMGYGMKNYDFIFLSRKWIKDKITMGSQLDRIDANARGKGPAAGFSLDKDGNWPLGEDRGKTWPYTIIIFPEGTNLSANTREKTEAYAAKVGKQPFRHVLLPKTTGLRFALLKLKNTVSEIYDVTIGYSGVRPDEYGQDIYKLESVLLEGKNPNTVEFYIRSFKISDIPIGKLQYDSEEEESKDSKIFEDWLFERWTEKDDLMERFYQIGTFVDKDEQLNVAETKLRSSKVDFAKIFAVPFIVILGTRLLYNYTLQKLF